jgi:hypothetical protein
MISACCLYNFIIVWTNEKSSSLSLCSLGTDHTGNACFRHFSVVSRLFITSETLPNNKLDIITWLPSRWIKRSLCYKLFSEKVATLFFGMGFSHEFVLRWSAFFFLGQALLPVRAEHPSVTNISEAEHLSPVWVEYSFIINFCRAKSAPNTVTFARILKSHNINHPTIRLTESNNITKHSTSLWRDHMASCIAAKADVMKPL